MSDPPPTSPARSAATPRRRRSASRSTWTAAARPSSPPASASSTTCSTRSPPRLIDLDIQAQGDLHIDGHHTVEDVGITLGQAVAQAVGDKKGLTRYGHAYVPLDEALSRVVVDFSGRPGLHMDVPFKAGMIGGFDTSWRSSSSRAFANHALVTLHIDNLKGDNAHHQCETVFKAFAPRAWRCAWRWRPIRDLGRRDPADQGMYPLR